MPVNTSLKFRDVYTSSVNTCLLAETFTETFTNTFTLRNPQKSAKKWPICKYILLFTGKKIIRQNRAETGTFTKLFGKSGEMFTPLIGGQK